MNLAVLAAKLAELPPEQRAELIASAKRLTAGWKWLPLPGPQSDAYFSQADITYFGGQGGGGKSDLILGLSLTAHQRSLIVRRQYTDLSALIDRCLEIHRTRKGYNGATPPRLTTEDGRIVDFGACARLGDEHHWQGQPHDLLAVEEAAQFAESQVRYLMGWVRSVVPGQRKRIIFVSNPPLTAEGEWLTRMFGPWLDRNHPRPAAPGELRWFVSDRDGHDVEVDGPEPVEIDGQKVAPMSRTFIPSALANNPYLLASGYGRTLDALPEPLRSAIRDGDFETVYEDDQFQLIPSDWIKQAQERWTPFPPANAMMSAMGVDVAAGGRDSTVIACRWGGWFDKLISVPGRETPLGSDTAGLILSKRRHSCPVAVDMQGGYGGAVFEHLQGNGVPVLAHKGAERSGAKTRDRKLGFANKRSEVWWLFREALDPDQPGGSRIVLPPDTTLLADLAAPRFSTVTIAGHLCVQAEPKADVVARLGRSPDRGDAVVMCYSAGEDVAPWKWGYGRVPQVDRTGGDSLSARIRSART